MARRHLVTGAAGVIGFDLTRALLERGDSVVAVDIGKKGGLADLEALASEHRSRLELRASDVARESAALAGRYDTLFHMAAIVGVRYVCEHPYETLDVNLRSTLQVLDRAIAQPPGAVLFASSSENYAGGADAGTVPIPTPEDVPLSIPDVQLPRWSYAASKMAGESALFAAARLAPFAPVVVRFHNVYGPRMGPTHVIPEMLARCRERVDPFPIFGPEQTRSFLHVADAARALCALEAHVAAGGAAAGGIYNVGSPLETRIDELARIVFRVTGFQPRLEAKPAPEGSVRRRVPDVRKLAALGFEPRIGLEEGIRGCWRV